MEGKLFDELSFVSAKLNEVLDYVEQSEFLNLIYDVVYELLKDLEDELIDFADDFLGC